MIALFIASILSCSLWVLFVVSNTEELEEMEMKKQGMV